MVDITVKIKGAELLAENAPKMKALAAVKLVEDGVLEAGKEVDFVNKTSYQGKNVMGKYILQVDRSLFSKFEKSVYDDFMESANTTDPAKEQHAQMYVDIYLGAKIEHAFMFAELALLSRPT